MRNQILFTTILCILTVFNAAAQKSEVSVNTLTGTANVVIPVYSLSRGAVTLPINLVYSATGVKPKDVEQNAGMGWNLQAGGAIIRTLRGLPDDIIADTLPSPRVGWMHSGMQSTINSFTIHNGGDADCSGQATDIANIGTAFTYQDDTEPDIFNVNAPGLSCQLVWDQSTSQFRTIPYMDLAITTTNHINDGSWHSDQITSFTIINDQGIKYVFAAAESALQQTMPSTGTTTGTYNQNYYQQFQNTVGYFDAWYLTSMTDANGNGVTLSYTTYPQRTGQDLLTLYGGAPDGATVTYPQYTTLTQVTPQVLSTIQTIDHKRSNQVLTFTWVTNPAGRTDFSGTGQSVVTSINGAGKNLVFNYDPVVYNGDTNPYYRFFLREFIDASTGAGCATPVDYKFGYYGETLSSTGTTTILSDSTSTKNIDYWGYYTSNPSDNTITPLYIDPNNTTDQRYVIPLNNGVGANYTVNLSGTAGNRLPDPANIMVGSLQKITYAQGGYTTLNYESNVFYDPLANVGNNGGGIRVNAIVDNDNVTGATVTRSYTYVDPSTGFPSGKPISLPVYGFATPYTGSATGTDYWNYGTMRSNIDLSQDDHTIMYTAVRMSQTGAGSTLYQYYVPATYFDASAYPVCCGTGSPEWYRTTDYTANPNCPASAGPPKNDIDTYPFIPNPNYDFERGLIKSVTTYNESATNNKTSETDYSYARTNSPGILPAFKYEWNTNSGGTKVMAYGKYIVYYGTSELVSQVNKTVYDSQGLNLAQTTTTNSTYGSTYHKLASQSVTNSDGSVLSTNYTYTKDLSATTGTGNVNIEAIYQLQQLNMDIPVESYTNVTRGGSTSVINAGMTLFSGFPGLGTTTLYLPASQSKFVQPDGGGAPFSPMSISGSTLSTDSRYIKTANFTQYDYTGVVQTADDAHLHVQGSVLDHNTYHPVVGVQNAAAYEIAFQDFDSDMVAPWTSSFSTFTGTQPAGSHTGLSQGMNDGGSFTYTIQKNNLANNYIFSIWLNPGASGSFNFNISSASGSTTPTVAFNNSSANWQYFEWVLPMPSTPSGNNTVTFTATASTGGVIIGIDDILLYPQTASANTGAFDQVTYYPTAQTNTNGVSSYATSDQWGRPLLQFDQDRNITQKKTYFTPGLSTSFPPPFFSSDIGGNTVYTTTPVTFTPFAYSSCYNEGLTYAWNFGDGTTTTPPGSPNPVTHTFGNSITTATTYPVTLTVASPTFGTYTSAPVNVIVYPPPPPTVNVTYEDYTFSNGTISTISFIQGGVVKYSFSGEALEAGQNIAQGVYDIQVYIAGGTLYNPADGSGYASITLGGVCHNFTAGNHYSFPGTDLSGVTSLDMDTSQFTCP